MTAPAAITSQELRALIGSRTSTDPALRFIPEAERLYAAFAELTARGIDAQVFRTRADYDSAGRVEGAWAHAFLLPANCTPDGWLTATVYVAFSAPEPARTRRVARELRAACTRRRVGEVRVGDATDGSGLLRIEPRR